MQRLKALAKGLLGAVGLQLTRLNDPEGRLLELRLGKLRPDQKVTPGTIVQARIDGRTVRFFVTDERDYIQTHHRSGRFYEEEVLARIAEHFRGGTFVDVGANVGNHSLYAALFLGARRVVAFDPVAEIASVLRVNVALNRLGDIVDIHEAGLSSAPGQAGFSTPRGNIGATQLHPDTNGPVRLVRGDDILGDEQVDFIKIDAEGMELEVLEGLRATIVRDHPALMVEVETAPNEAGFFRFLERVGYRVEGDPIVDADCANYIAVPND